jgi:ATP-dependent exoDNAse (exonuclease V) beta subunit
LRRLSFTALSTFEQCSYRYYARYVAGMPERKPSGTGEGGLRATEIGDAVHKLLEQVDLAAPALPDVDQVRVWYPTVSDEEVERIRAYVASYCESELARRVSSLDGVRKERHFTFEHEGVLLHGFVDAMHLDGAQALVVDYKTNLLGESSPEEIVEVDYSLQRLVYALACFRAGAEEVEVVYHFLERPDAVVSRTFTRTQVGELEAELAAGIARIHTGEFVPTPSEFACAGCPALDLVCAGPRLGSDPFQGSDPAVPTVVGSA